MGTGGAQTKEQLILDAYDWTGADLKFTVRNVGSANVTIAAVYLEGQAKITSTSTVGIGMTTALTITSPTGFSAGASYVLKIVSITGATFTYSVIKGRAA